MDKLTRRNIRYLCFRLQTEAEGGPKAKPEKTGLMSHVEEIKKQMESQPEFDGWKKFAKTWDVDETAKLVAVNRNSSIQADWNKTLKKEAKELPTATKKKKSPSQSGARRGPGGRFISKSVPIQTPDVPPVEPPKKSFWEKLT